MKIGLMGKKVAIVQSNYIPWKGYFDMIASVDEFVLYDDVQFTKRDWRNRNRIKTDQGLKWLTVPVEVKGRFSQKISETKISSDNWAEKHWEMIRRNYRRARGFECHGAKIEQIYSGGSGIGNLSQLNEYFLKRVCGMLGIVTPLRQSSEFELASERNERLLSICIQSGATHYLSGPSAKDYLDRKVFEENGIEVEWMEYGSYPKYPQLHGDFDHAVSILDLILNVEKPRAYAFSSPL